MFNSHSQTYPSLNPQPAIVTEEQKSNYAQEKEVQRTWVEWKAKGKESAQAEQAFATAVFTLWQRFKAQGNRKGAPGFKAVIKRLHIDEKQAYKSLWKAFPQLKPTSRRNGTKLPLPRLELRTLKELAGKPGFREEIEGQLNAIANAVAERYGCADRYQLQLTVCNGEKTPEK
jgi:hypothetical protein